jgi:hypothetical protein
MNLTKWKQRTKEKKEVLYDKKKRKRKPIILEFLGKENKVRPKDSKI